MWPETTQARATLIAGIALALASAIFSVMQADYFNLLTIAVFMTPIIVLTAYDIQCIVNGQCEVYSWIKTLLFLIAIAFAFYAEAFRQYYYFNNSPSPSPSPRTTVVYVTASNDQNQNKKDDDKLNKNSGEKDDKKSNKNSGKKDVSGGLVPNEPWISPKGDIII